LDPFESETPLWSPRNGFPDRVEKARCPETPNGTIHLVRPRENIRVCTERNVRRVFGAVLFHLQARLSRNATVLGKRAVTAERLLEQRHAFEPRTVGDDHESATHLVGDIDAVQLFQ
jgi:hypothetical protein